MNEYYVEYFDTALQITAFTLIEAINEAEAKQIFEEEFGEDQFAYIEEYEHGDATNELCFY